MSGQATHFHASGEAVVLNEFCLLSVPTLSLITVHTHLFTNQTVWPEGLPSETTSLYNTLWPLALSSIAKMSQDLLFKALRCSDASESFQAQGVF